MRYESGNMPKSASIKPILFSFIMVFMSNMIYAQDIIHKRNGDQIKSKVVEITFESIKYKDFEFQEGPIRNIRISDVSMIIYQNGKKETFSSSEPLPIKPVIGMPGSVKIEAQRRIIYKGNYFMVGPGIGDSYGGLGVRIVRRFGRITGFGVQVGLGYGVIVNNDNNNNPDIPFLFTYGVKFYPYKGIYINAIGGTYHDSAKGKNISYGPSFIIGIDQTFGSKVAFGFNGGLGITRNNNTGTLYHFDWTPTIDMGFVVRF
jgi:hypothetical protein